jgi:S-adenosylmethionine decarboxylase
MTEIINPLGLHKLLTLYNVNPVLVTNLNLFRDFTDAMLLRYELEQVGFSSFVFENNSYTAAYCLKESHICIHTWPENNTLTMDVYLCNYSQDNSEKVRSIAKEYVAFFEAAVKNEFEINR